MSSRIARKRTRLLEPERPNKRLNSTFQRPLTSVPLEKRRLPSNVAQEKSRSTLVDPGKTSHLFTFTFDLRDSLVDSTRAKPSTKGPPPPMVNLSPPEGTSPSSQEDEDIERINEVDEDIEEVMLNRPHRGKVFGHYSRIE